jgi:hypothetical protein
LGRRRDLVRNGGEVVDGGVARGAGLAGALEVGCHGWSAATWMRVLISASMSRR